MFVNLIYLERGYFEKLVVIILVVLMYLVCKGVRCEK